MSATSKWAIGISLTILLASATPLVASSIEHGKKILVLETLIDKIEQRLERIELKLDKILEEK